MKRLNRWLCVPFYVKKKNLILDIRLIIFTAIAIFSKKTSLSFVNKLLVKYECDEKTVEVCRRQQPLKPYPPPGSNEIVSSRS